MNTRDTLYVENGKLYIGGFSAEELAKKYSTPLYVMDGGYVKEVCTKMISALSSYGEGAVAFASKAFATVATTKLMDGTGMWFDCVSGGELHMLLSAGVKPNKIIFHGNAKTPKELAEGVQARIGYFVIDSVQEIDNLDREAKKNDIKQDVLVRINPLVSAHTYAAVQTAAPGSKFGFDVSGDAVERIKQIANKNNLNFKGLHIHIGSQIYEHSSYAQAVEVMCDLISRLNKEGISVPVLDLGGGFGVYYTDEDPRFTASRYAYTLKNVASMLSDGLFKRGLSKPFLIFEPGRSVVGEAGVTLYTVTAIKDFPGVKKYVAVDGGMFDNPRSALYGAHYSAVLASRADEKAEETVTIAGKCCESGDIISEDVKLAPAREGDLLAVFTTGAYNYSMASHYNLNAVPPVVLVDGDKEGLIVAPESYEDLLRQNRVPEWLE